MSQYGSAANLSQFRERTGSPSYASLGKHRDDYNRFETARHAANSNTRNSVEHDESRFSGFGDRPGSGVELSGFNWNGGELITNERQLPKAIKPRTMFYSPIGDGTVAADGYELKRRPMDLSPRVTVTQLQHIERGAKGHDGVNIIEKNWSTGGGSVAPSEAGFGSEYGPGSGRNSRAGGGALSPEPLPKKNDFGNNYHPAPPKSDTLPHNNAGANRPNSGLGNHGPNHGLGNHGDGGHPFGGSQSNLGPRDGRNSVASSVFSDPSYRLDTKTGYLITNPRELIHQFATMTPVATIDDSINNTPATTTVQKQSYYKRTEETTEEQYAPHAPYKTNHPVQSPNRFVRQLRDDNLTHSQREANTHIDPVNHRDPHFQQRVQEFRSKTQYTSSRGGDDIDALTQQLVSGLHTGKSKYQ